MGVTKLEINFFGKSKRSQYMKIPFISNLKKPACAWKRDVL